MRRKLLVVLLALIVCFTCSLNVHAATISDSGWSSSTSGTSSGATATRSGGKISLSATGYALLFSKYERTAKITLTNGTGAKQVLSGDMVFAGTFGSYSITLPDGTTVSGSSAYTYSQNITMEAGESLTITVTSTKGNSGAITCSYTPTVTASVSKTITCNTAAGGTYTVNGNTVSSVSFEVGDTLTLAATPDKDYVCLGFLLDDTTLLPMDSSNLRTWVPTDSHTITPVFAQLSDTSAPFSVDGKNYYTWETAFTAAGAKGTVVVAKDYTLPTTYAANGMTGAGTFVSGTDGALVYSIHSGQSLLVPYDSNYTATFNTSPKTLSIDSYKPGYKDTVLTGSTKGTQYPYRTLTVDANTTITCYGTINVNSQVIESTSTHSGCPVGPYGQIKLSDSSSKLILASANTSDALTTNNTAGIMYCYGYVTGNGRVEVQSGAKLYEMIQALGWRGGSMVKSWLSQAGITNDDTSISSFIFSDYAIQNVEADLLICTGAECNILFVVDTSKSDPKIFTAAYISTNSGFVQLGSNGNVLREYDATSNRMQHTLNGTISIANLDINVDFSKESVAIQAIVSAQLGTTQFALNTGNHIFGIAPGMEYIVDSGSTVTLKHTYKMLPDTSITVKGAGTDIFGNTKGKGTLNVDGTLYLYDAADYLDHGYTFYRLTTSPVNGSYYGHWDSIPVPFIATTLKSCWRGLADAEFLTEIVPLDQRLDVPSAQLVVNGNLNVSGNGAVYTSDDGGTSADKVITGTGTFTYNAKTGTNALDEMHGLYDGSDFWVDPVEISTVKVVGLLAGISESEEDVNDSFSAATYYGQDNGYWYSYTVTANGGEVNVATVNAATGNTSGVVAKVAHGGTVTFTAEGYDVAIGDTALEPDENGIYTLTNVSADTILTLTLPCQHTNTTIMGQTAPTCSEQGYTGDTVCDDCGATVEQGSQIPTTSHAMGAWSDYDHSSNPIVRFRTCSVCGSEDTDTVDAVAVTTVNSAKWFGATLSETVSASDGSGGSTYIQMINDSMESESEISKAVCIDLAGKNVSVKKLSNAKMLDSTTDGYTNPGGKLTIDDDSNIALVTSYDPDGDPAEGEGDNITPKHYVKVDNGDGTYSFRRVGISLTGAQFIDNKYLVLEATFKDSQVAATGLLNMGFNYNGKEVWYNKTLSGNQVYYGISVADEVTGDVTDISARALLGYGSKTDASYTDVAESAWRYNILSLFGEG